MDLEFDYDFFVIGGGSGGMGASKEAAKYGAKVAVADYVVPSPQGTSWGLGGTCVNVGCVPKKMMHTAALLGEKFDDQIGAGWPVRAEKQSIHWPTMQDVVGKRIKRINGFYEKALVDNKVTYYNKLARFKDNHTIELYTPDNESNVETIRAKYILICVGGRPTLPPKDEVENVAELAITSDDVFWLKESPGKTCMIGGGYIALETAGFLKGFGNDVSILVRSRLLRSFDEDMAQKIGAHMENDKGIKFHYKCELRSIKKLENGKKLVTWENVDTNEKSSEEFDTVMYAIGRTAETDKLNIKASGVELNSKNKKVKVNKEERTNVENIFAVGDCADEIPELTPVAIRAGRLLARRLFNNETELFDYDIIPTAVFTPLEYGSIGLSEERAKKKHGESNIEIYHSFFKPLEWNVVDLRSYNTCYAKLIVNTADNERVVGFHYFGPDAGEITQGYAVAIQAGATLADFHNTVAIHPTCSEEMVLIDVNKKDGNGAIRGCCG